MEVSGKPEVRWNEWFSEGWHMFAQQWKVWALITFIHFLIYLLSFAFVFGSILAVENLRDKRLTLFGALAIAISVLLVIGVCSWLMAGMYQAAFRQLRGELIGIKDSFISFSRVPSVLRLGIVVGFLTLIGAIACIIPAFLVMGLFFFSYPSLIERDLGVMEALRQSYEYTKRNLLMFTLFAFVLYNLSTLGAVACYVGLLVSWPLFFTISVIAYRDCFDVEGAIRFSPTRPVAESPPAP